MRGNSHVPFLGEGTPVTASPYPTDWRSNDHLRGAQRALASDNHLRTALIGAWAAASGCTEIVVSGTEVLARLGGSIRAATAQQIRARADTAFVTASMIIIGGGALYLPIARRWITPRKPGTAPTNSTKTSSASGGTNANLGQATQASSAETEG
jgi:hypothetical protein